MAFDCIVAGAHLRHDGVRSRVHHLLERFAAHVPVLFVEEAFYGSGDRDELLERDAFTVLRPVRRSFDTARLDEDTLDAVDAWLGRREPLVWLTTPSMRELADSLAGKKLVYDCARDLAALAYVPLEMRVRERALVERADLVFAASQALFDMYERYGEHVRLAPSGVEFAHFSRARTLEPHPLLLHLSRPIAGYAGTIDERIDFEIVRALGESGVNVVVAGPIVRIDPAVLPRRGNIHFTGQLDYGELPSLLVGFDVALVPFVHAGGGPGISPSQVPEYLAAGKPTVATPLVELQAEWADLVTYAETPEGFVAACEVAANQPDPARVEAGIERARALDWDTLAAGMWSEIAAASDED
jgi:glycosyltransferase involved in cell wall biosynthesis